MIYFDYMKLLLKGTLQYRASLLMLTVGQFISAFGYFFGVVFLFQRFGSLAGWEFRDVALCFGVSSMAFYLSNVMARGFDVFQRFIRSGSFDRMLLRPRSLVLQVITSELNITHLGRVLQGFLVLAYVVGLYDDWTGMKTLCVALMVLCGSVVFSGVYVLGSTVCFWTVKGLEFINIFSDGGREIASYPITIFGKHMTRFFTFLLPYACFNYLPLRYVAGRTENPLYLLIPLAGMLFIIPCLAVWRFGVRHYVSTGS